MFADGQNLERDSQFIQKIVDTRNYYTHYDPKKINRSFTPAELSKVNYKLMLLLEYHILKLLGFEESELRKKYIENINRLT